VATRSRVGRQVALYRSDSIACIAGTNLATGAIANLIPPAHRFRLAIVGTRFLVVSVTSWLVKSVIYQSFIVPMAKAESGDAGLNDLQPAIPYRTRLTRQPWDRRTCPSTAKWR